MFICAFVAGWVALAPGATPFSTRELSTARVKDAVRAQRMKAQALCQFLARTYDAMEELGDALHYARLAARLGPSAESDMLRLAMLQAKAGDPREGLGALVRAAAVRKPSVTLCRAIEVLALEAGDPAMAGAWRRQGDRLGAADARAHLAAASWLASAGQHDLCTADWEHAIEIDPDSHQAAAAHQSLARAAAQRKSWAAAAAHYLRAAAIRRQRYNYVDARSRADAATGHAYRALARALEGDDAGSQEDLAVAVRWAQGEASRLRSVLLALNTAPPAPWFLRAVEGIAGNDGWARAGAMHEAVRDTAERWLAYQHSLPGLKKSKRELEDEELRRLAEEHGPVCWIADDPYSRPSRWIGTATGFIMLDDRRHWVVTCWPQLLEELGVDGLSARCVAFTESKVWVGSDQGLFAFDRDRAQWLQVVIGDDIVEGDVTDLRVVDGLLTAVVVVDEKESRWSLDLQANTWRQP